MIIKCKICHLFDESPLLAQQILRIDNKKITAYTILLVTEQIFDSGKDVGQ